MAIKILCIVLCALLFCAGCKTNEINIRDYQGIDVSRIEDEEVKEQTVKFLSKYDILVKLNFQLETKCGILEYENKTYKKIIDTVDIDKNKKLETKRDLKPFWYFLVGVVVGAGAVGLGVGLSK